ncbi:hypothetical protein ACIQNG_05615 [Streptomyces sp. NPDC091377]|uniref:hypothetical protein n=1 Tax=Streptomyces sp. NPDC091377 TaxID=3365995 RepID=UPI0037FCDBEF
MIRMLVNGRTGTLVMVGAAVMALAGCGSESGSARQGSDRPPKSSSAPPATTQVKLPERTLKARDIEQTLPDAKDLPGWKTAFGPRATQGREGCQDLLPGGCPGTVASGGSDVTRGKRTPEEWVRIGFNLYSSRSDRAAHDLFTELPLRGTEVKLRNGVPADEHIATREKMDETIVLGSKTRVDDVLLWVYVMGSEQSATIERLESALRLTYERLEQAKHGEEPNISATIE